MPANAREQMTQETLLNGLVSIRAYDAVTGWLKSIQTGAGGGTGVQNLEYAWDKLGNLSSRIDKNQSNLTESFVYDNLYRLDYSQRNGVTNLNRRLRRARQHHEQVGCGAPTPITPRRSTRWCRPERRRAGASATTPTAT